MEIVIILVIPLLILLIAWYQNEYDMTVRKGKKFGERENRSVTFKKHKFDKKQAEENDKAYKRWKEARESNLEQTTQAKLEKKTLPDEYYKSEKYQKFCEERARKYNEAVNEGRIAGEVKKIGGGLVGSQKEEVFYGERGGRYRIRYNKDGAPYRDYF